MIYHRVQQKPVQHHNYYQHELKKTSEDSLGNHGQKSEKTQPWYFLSRANKKHNNHNLDPFHS